MNRWQRWRAKHWDEYLEGEYFAPGHVSLGYMAAPPLRRAARWVHANGWKLIGTAIAAIAATAALIQALQP